MYLPLERKQVPEASGLKGLETGGEIFRGGSCGPEHQFPGMVFTDVSTSGAHQGGTWSIRILNTHLIEAVRL